MHNKPEATPLQLVLEPQVTKVIREAGRNDPEVSCGSLEAPFYNPGDPVLDIQIATDDVRVWLGDASAHFAVGSIQDGFERASFSSDASFCNAFLSALRAVLSP